MKSKLYVVFVAVVMITMLSACGSLPVANNTVSPQNLRTINVNGSGKVYLVPDVAYIYIGVRTQADGVGDALNENNSQAQKIASALKEMGIADKDIQTTAFNVYPQQEYSPEGTIIRTYYVVENTVYVTVRDLTKLGETLDTVVRSGANSINGISFDVQDRAKAESDARKMAIADARARADEIAAAAGVQVGDVQTISVYSNNAPMPMYDAKGGGMMAEASQVPVAAGQMVITADASVTFLIK